MNVIDRKATGDYSDDLYRDMLDDVYGEVNVGVTLLASRVLEECDPVALLKRIHRVETAGRQLMTDYCNGRITLDGVDKISDKQLARVRAILGPGPEIIGNRDPRGHYLKINDETARHLRIYRDMGGYGVICPEFDGD